MQSSKLGPLTVKIYSPSVREVAAGSMYTVTMPDDCVKWFRCYYREYWSYGAGYTTDGQVTTDNKITYIERSDGAAYVSVVSDTECGIGNSYSSRFIIFAGPSIWYVAKEE